MVQIRQGHLSRCHGDKVTPGDDLISPWISTCVSECVLHENAVIPPPYQMQRFTLKPNLKVKLLLFLHILTVSLFLFLTLKFLCNILAISFFFCYAYQEHFFLLIPFSLHHYLCSFQMRKEDRGQSCLQKDFDALVEGLKTLTGFHPGSGSSMARNANTAGRKRKKKDRESMKEEIERKTKRKLLGSYLSILSPFLWWSHLLREEDERDGAQCKN